MVQMSNYRAENERLCGTLNKLKDTVGVYNVICGQGKYLHERESEQQYTSGELVCHL